MRADLVHWLAQYMSPAAAATIAPTWFTCVGLAGLVTLCAILVGARRRGLDVGAVASVCMAAYVAAVLAGIIVPMVIQAITTLIATGQFHLRWAGMTSFWGYLAGMAAIAIVCHRHDLPLARFADLAAAPIGLALVLARTGCFLGGCDYGQVTSSPLGVRFPAGSPAWRDHVHAGLVSATRGESLPVHPTQLYEAALGLVLVAVAVIAGRQTWGREGRGRIMLAVAATYSLGRIAIETLRGDLGRGIYAGLSSGQIFSLGVLVAIATCLLVARRRTVLVVTAASIALLVGGGASANAQPAPADPYASPAPYTPPYNVYRPDAPPPTVIAPPATPSSSHLTIGLALGVSGAMNRRADQVPALGGISLTVGWIRRGIGLWGDFDSYGNDEATHGTFLLSAGARLPIRSDLSWMARAGLGGTLVNFKNDVFTDVAGTTFRVEGGLDYQLTPRWVAYVRPIAFDYLVAAELGGPILSYQARIGIAIQIGLGGSR